MIVKTWDGNNINDGTNLETIINARAYGLPAISPRMGQREGEWPVIAAIGRPGEIIALDIYIRNYSTTALKAFYQNKLMQWFDPDDETPKQLMFDTDPSVGSTNLRFNEGICVELAEVPLSGGLHYVASIQIHGDIYLREDFAFSPTALTFTSHGDTDTVSASGEKFCKPSIRIKPNSNKTGSWPWKRFVPVKWNGDAGSDYPLDIVNNGLDTRIASTNFALASGNDLRVWVDGIEDDRWLDGPDTSTTKVWVNLDFVATIALTLDGSIASGLATIPVNESINSMPNSGIIYIDSEAITYTSKNNASKTFNNCSRGAKGTTAASHTGGTTVHWLQHDIWILYGNSAAGSPPASATTKPMFRLDTSTNTSWDYDDFNDPDPFWPFVADRAAKWLFNPATTAYTATEGGSADPQSVMGMTATDFQQGNYRITNPCGITVANFQNGKKRTTDFNEWGSFEPCYIHSDVGGVEFYIPAPTANNSWQTWSRSETLTAGTQTVKLWTGVDWFETNDIEASDVTLTLDSSNTPIVVIGGEQANYLLDCEIWNQTTDQRIKIQFTMALTEEIEVDTDNKTVIYLEDGSNQFKSLTLVGGPRRDWFKLEPGVNTITFYDVGTVSVDVKFEFFERYYH